MSMIPTQFDKHHPFMSSVKERYNLCKVGSHKNTQHIVLDLKGSGITYNVGDSLGIIPINDSKLILRTLAAMKANGTEIIKDKHSESTILLHDFLKKKANITQVSRKFISELAIRQTHLEKRDYFDFLLKPENKNELREYLETHEIWDTLEENQEANFTIQEICDLFMPLLPRLYSISSSQKEVHDTVHLTVSLLEYKTNGHHRFGVCTHYLCNLVNINEPIVPIYIQPSHGFTLPEDPKTSMIMVGPGTGVAPFRAFMQERMRISGEGKNWLFFGECHRSFEFFYEEYWHSLQNQGKLILDTAFSRDQETKIYVQHKLLENGAEIYSWLEEGAYFYVCGDANHMAKDVEAALLTIIKDHGNVSEQAAKEYVKKLRTSKRYLRDIY